MITLLKRHEIQVLLNAGHTQAEVASVAKVSERSVRRIAAEAAVEHVDDRQERVERRIGRPRQVDRFRPLVEQLLKETDEDRAPLKSVEILRRVRLDGYDGGSLLRGCSGNGASAASLHLTEAGQASAAQLQTS